ncbi:MAG: hypothetical protein ABFS22_09990 [Pseudomonadota bacterium]
MKKLISVSPITGLLTMLSGNAHASVSIPVPEIDAGTAAIAIGLTLGVVALVREHRRRK